MKIVRIISEHQKKGSKGMVEAIVKLKDGTLATRHIFPADADKTEESNVQSA